MHVLRHTVELLLSPFTLKRVVRKQYLAVTRRFAEYLVFHPAVLAKNRHKL